MDIPKSRTRLLTRRDQDDYRIDWRQSAGQIKRFVDAVGHPYRGLTSASHGEFLRIIRVTVEKDVNVSNAMKGKLSSFKMESLW